MRGQTRTMVCFYNLMFVVLFRFVRFDDITMYRVERNVEFQGQKFLFLALYSTHHEDKTFRLQPNSSFKK